MKLSPLKRQQILKAYPQLSTWLDQQEANQKFESLLSSVSMMKGEKGEDGKDGYTPVKGKDYFTQTELNQIIKYIKDNVVTNDILLKATPKKGIHYNDGLNGKDGKRGEKGNQGTKGDKGDKGDAGSDTPEQIVSKIKSVGLDISLISGAVGKKELLEGMAKVDGRMKLIDQRFHGAGISKVVTDSTLTGNGTGSSPLSVVGGGSGLSRITLTGIVDGQHNTYTSTLLPTWLVIDGAWYEQKDYNGNTLWSFTGVIGAYTITSTVYPNVSAWGF